MANPPPAGTVLRIRGNGVPRISITPNGQTGSTLALRTPQQPVLLRVPGQQGPAGPAGGAEVFAFSGTGVEYVRPGRHRVRLEVPYTVASVVATVGQPPLGSPLVVDVFIDLDDGAGPQSIFTDPLFRPTIAPTTREDSGSSWLPVLPANAFLSCGVVDVGAVFPGADLATIVRLNPV